MERNNDKDTQKETEQTIDSEFIENQEDTNEDTKDCYDNSINDENNDEEEKLIQIIPSENDTTDVSGMTSDDITCTKEIMITADESKSEPTSTPTDASSIAAQFNKIVRARKTTVPRCRRSAVPCKATPRYMTQPVMSEKQGSIESLRDSSCVDKAESGSASSVQDITNNPIFDKQTSNSGNTSLLNKYSRTLSGTTRLKKDSTEINESPVFFGKLDCDNKSDKSIDSGDLSVSPEKSNSVFYEDSKHNNGKSVTKTEKNQSDATKQTQNSLPTTLRKNVPQHIRIHSDEIKPNSDPIADVTSEYLNRKISKTDKKEELPFPNTSIGTRISPFRYAMESSQLDSAVLKSPSAQALMKTNLSRSRSGNSKIQPQDREDLKIDYEAETHNILQTSFDNSEDKPEIQSEKVMDDISESLSLSKQKLEKRYLIIQELINVESEYVKHYMIPLKLEKLIDDSQVDAIFNKITEFLNYHSMFLGKLQSLEIDDTVGDQISQMALIVQPVQRIPRYELLIKRLIEYTPAASIDNEYLIDAQASVHQLALKINAVKESKQDESINEGLKLLDRLLSPMIILTSVKKRGTQTTKKPPVLRLITHNGLDFIDNIKYKFVSRINIENIEFETNEDTDQKILLRNKEMKDRKDLGILNEIETLLLKLERKHCEVDNCIKKIYTTIVQDMEDAKFSKMINSTNNSSACQFLVTTKEGIERMDFIFNSVEKKHSWQKTVMDLKNKLVDVPRTPRFNEALSVTRTQSGMQFCCASPIEGYNNCGLRDVWICQSDGFTGHLCLLSMQNEPIVTMNSPLPGCNSKLICIIAVPGYTGSTRRSSLNLENRFNIISQLKLRQKNDSNILLSPIESREDDNENDENNTKRNLEDSSSQSCSESGEEGDEECNAEESQRSKKLNDPYKATMWIGLEDGSMLVFYSAENVRMTKSKRKVDLGSPIISMMYFDNHVYISLINGEFVTFKRHIEGYWDFENPHVTKISTQSYPIKNLTAVTGFIWGTSNKNIFIINPVSVKIENSFTVIDAADQRPISHIACSGQCVWLAQENSAKILLYHATSYEYLYEINIRPNIVQNIQMWDDIIIKHKEACLRITSILVCKDLLWVGTSAGLILTILIPNVTTATTKSTLFHIQVEALDRGHTGPVRFLVGLESSIRPTHQSSRRQSLSPCTTMATQMKVISGGDGLEDFSLKTNKESSIDIGKDDATNYILIWDIQ